MAQHPNVGLIRTGYEAFSRGDLETLADLFTTDVQWHEAGRRFALAGDYKGQEAVFTLFAQLMELTGGTFEVRLEECIADDRQAVAIHAVTARNGARTYAAREAIVFHLLEGKVTDAWHTVPDVDAYDAFWAAPEPEPMEALLRRGYHAFATGDIATMTELIADDAVWRSTSGSPFDGEYVGRDEIFAMFARLMAETEGTFRIELGDIACNDDRAVVMARTTATRKGRTLTADQVFVHRMRDGQTVEFTMATADPVAMVAFWQDE